MKRNLLLLAFLLPLFFGFSKPTYTYYIKQQAPLNLDTTFVYPNSQYIYQVLVKEQVNGFFNSTFKAILENGTFENGTTTMDNLPINYNLYVKWNDQALTSGKISIIESFKDTAVQLVKGRTEITKLIASLKGQTPVVAITGSSNPPMGSKIQLTAQVLGDFIYPGIYERNEYGVIVNKKVKQFQWTLPPNWKTVPPRPSVTFTTEIGVNQIIVEPDYFTPGAIQVRGVNDLGTAYSETFVKNYDRGFAFTNYPSSIIPFGQIATYTFAVTPIAGVSFEWEVPSGWQINGQGNLLEGMNMNSINVTTTGFCSNSSVVRVRLKKDTEISGWFVCIYPGVSQPTITSITSPIYQYEDANFSISNISPSDISAITWTGDGVITTYNQGADSKLVLTKSGSDTITASILMRNCTTPITRTKVVTVNPCRLFISGSSELCSQSTYTINYLPSSSTISWTYSSNLDTVQTGNGSITLRPIGSGWGTINATVTIGSSQFALPQRTVWVGLKASFTGSSSVNYLGTGSWQAGASCGAEPYIFEWYLRKAGSGANALCVSNEPELILRSVKEGTSLSVLSAKDPIVNQPITYTIFYLFLRVTDDNGIQYETSEQQIYAYGKVDLVPLELLRMNESIQSSEIIQTESIEVFPNPTSENVTVKINDENFNTESIDIIVFDKYMNKIKTLKVKNRETSINISEYKAGIYFVQVLMNNKQWIQKVIKQ